MAGIFTFGILGAAAAISAVSAVSSYRTNKANGIKDTPRNRYRIRNQYDVTRPHAPTFGSKQRASIKASHYINNSGV